MLYRRRRFALAWRYGLARSPEADAARWSENSRKWWARAEREAPDEVLAYRQARAWGTEAERRVALAALKDAMR